MQASSKPNFYNKHCPEIICFSLSALAVVVFLTMAFVWFDATNLPGGNSFSGAVDPPKVHRPKIKQHTASQDLLAAASSLLQDIHLRISPSVSASFAYANLNAAFSPDNMMWRHTPDGWKDISMMSNQAQNAKPLLEGVHPAIWAAILLLSSLLLLIMASNDTEIQRLLGRPSNPKNKT